MVIDLTQDSESERDASSSPEVLSNQLLDVFMRPKSTASSLTRSQHITSGPTSSSRPGSKSSNISVLITLQKPPSSNANRKRSLSTTDDVNTNPSHRLAEHHGLSYFYSVDNPAELKRPYNKFKQYDRKAEIPRPTKRYIPPKRQADGKPVSDRLEALYKQKLSRIQGPPIHFVARNMAHKVDFNFDFIDSYKLHDGVEVLGPEFLCGCSCTECGRDCSCLFLESDSNKLINPYQDGQHGSRVLTPEFIKKRAAVIQECSSRCNCSGSNCLNHVVYRGRQVELEIFQTNNRGFGIRSPNPIERGQFIDIYVGEVIVKTSSNAREEAFDTRKHSSYLFSLDFYEGYEGVDANYVVDGRKFGSITRFMNHSCNPTCKMFAATQTNDMKVYQLAFFAVRDIPAGTELTFDYHPRWKKKNQKIDPSATKCLCGESNCRGQLWPTKRKTTRAGDDESSSDEESSEEGSSNDDEE
ncbi:putative [histone H3]-lysine(4) N-trimethyltransferase [Microsporum ferrugineum]